MSLAGVPLLVVVPLVGALVAALVGRRWERAAWWIVTAALVFAAADAFHVLVRTAGGEVLHYAMGGWPVPTGIEYRIDVLNAIVLVMVSSVALLAVLWSPPSVAREIRRAAHASWYAVALLFVTGLLGITITGDVFNMYVFLEISSITAYVLVAMGRRRQSLYAGFSYLVLGSIGATFVLIGIGHIYMATGSLGMEDIASRIEGANALRPATVHVAFAFIAVGLALKMALFPLHSWQPGAYTHAPSMGSLLLAATATKVAAYAFYRISFTVFGPHYLAAQLPAILDGLLVMALAAMIIGPLLALKQDDLKRMLAYSSVGQIGYVVLGAVLLTEGGHFNETALTGSLVHFWNHAASKGALFAVAGIVALRAGSTRLSALDGLGRRAPWTATAMTIAACSLVGVPLTGGFITKYYLAVGMIESGRAALLGILLLSSLLTAVYMWRCLQRVWFAPADVQPPVAREAPWSMRFPTLVLAALCLVLGVAAFLSVDLAAAASRMLLNP